MAPIEQSLPDAVGAWVHWLVRESGWTVTERREGTVVEVPVEPRHVCILFRRFINMRSDVTRPYVDALEARSVPHLLVGGRSFHDREEVETLRAALAAVEWPEDALNVYATLRGALFAIGEETLLEYWHTHPRHRFHPFDVPEDLAPRLQPVGDALALLRTLHAGRNHRPAAETVGRLLEHTRAHVSFVMRPAGERVLANVLQVVELARQYQADGGISFRGFVDALREASDRQRVGRSPGARGRQRRRPPDDRAQGEGPRVPCGHPRGYDVQAQSQGRQPLHRPGAQPLRDAAGRVFARRPAGPRGR